MTTLYDPEVEAKLEKEREGARLYFSKWLEREPFLAATLSKNSGVTPPHVSKLRSGRLPFTLQSALMIEKATRFEKHPLSAEKLLAGQPECLEIIRYIESRNEPAAGEPMERRKLPVYKQHLTGRAVAHYAPS